MSREVRKVAVGKRGLSRALVSKYGEIAIYCNFFYGVFRIPSFFILAWWVVGLMSNIVAAPLSPLACHLVGSSASRMCCRSCRSRVMNLELSDQRWARAATRPIRAEPPADDHCSFDHVAASISTGLRGYSFFRVISFGFAALINETENRKNKE